MTLVDHPLVQYKMSRLRDKDTEMKEFRELIEELTVLIGYEATRDLPLMEKFVETPIAVARTMVLADKVCIVPILRAGLGMVDGFLRLLPVAKVGHIGMYRDPVTHEPVSYYCKLPVDVMEHKVMVVDPMLATGGSAVAAIDEIKDRGCKDITFVCILGSREGIRTLSKRHPDVKIFVACIDDTLNDQKYIVPGLGDAGDRLFGTK
ncbi:MAG: uracil phosphoribosyltransferase [Candidatus Methanomethylophilaceae archaeon]